MTLFSPTLLAKSQTTLHTNILPSVRHGPRFNAQHANHFNIWYAINCADKIANTFPFIYRIPAMLLALTMTLICRIVKLIIEPGSASYRQHLSNTSKHTST